VRDQLVHFVGTQSHFVACMRLAGEPAGHATINHLRFRREGLLCDMDSNRYGIGAAIREARRRLIEDMKLQHSPPAPAFKYDTTSNVYTTQAEALTGHVRGPTGRKRGVRKSD
jgi:hypothetical protein